MDRKEELKKIEGEKGEKLERTKSSIDREGTCPCGSGKKYKDCCLLEKGE